MWAIDERTDIEQLERHIREILANVVGPLVLRLGTVAGTIDVLCGQLQSGGLSTVEIALLRSLALREGRSELLDAIERELHRRSTPVYREAIERQWSDALKTAQAAADAEAVVPSPMKRDVIYVRETGVLVC